jgi:pimeloyl-ACP methyl ester carboxylesterase
VQFLEHFVRLDLRTFAALADEMQRFDPGELLEKIDVPVLIIAAEKDRFAPVGQAQAAARRIPGAELMILPGGSHAALIEQPGALADRIERFMRERVLGAWAARQTS